MTSAQKAAATRAQNKARDERLARFQEALTTERAMFNSMVDLGRRVVLETAFGPYVVKFVDRDHWYHTLPVAHEGDSLASVYARSFAGCNDGTWARLLESAGVARQGINAEVC